MRPIGTIVVVADESVAEVVRSLGWDVDRLEYFWGDAVDRDWVAAVVDIRVGGNTGLSVASRFDRERVTPIVLFSPGDRHRVGTKFAGIERTRGVHLPEFRSLLAVCVRESIRRRAAARCGSTTGIDVGDSMIVGLRDE